jgi:hypothetical protein
MQRLNEAYRVLSSAPLRAKYDAQQAGPTVGAPPRPAPHSNPMGNTSTAVMAQRILRVQVEAAALVQAKKEITMGLSWAAFGTFFVSIGYFSATGNFVYLLFWLAIIYGLGLVTRGVHYRANPWQLVKRQLPDHEFHDVYRGAQLPFSWEGAVTGFVIAGVLGGLIAIGHFAHSGIVATTTSNSITKSGTTSNAIGNQQLQNQVQTIKSDYYSCQDDLQTANNDIASTQAEMSADLLVGRTASYDDLVPVKQSQLASYNTINDRCNQLRQSYNQATAAYSESLRAQTTPAPSAAAP